MDELKWRFPAVQGGQVVGTTTGDKEIFRKSLYKSLAREVLQNSIDVCNHDNEPVKVEFRTFKLRTDRIPDLVGLRNQIRRCRDFFAFCKETKEKYDAMEKMLESEEIECLRISDFNTTGLLGIYSRVLEDNSFMALVKGTGISVKASSTAGGSKGVGKNAAIVLSDLSCVWYVTLTKKDEKGSIGKADFASGYQEGHENDKQYYTQGAGYYSSNENNDAITEIINLDSEYAREEYGTDIYILAFRKDDDWKEEVIESVIDSFAVAIYKKKLSVEIDGTVIDSSTLKEVISEISNDKICRAALSTYKILSNEDNNVKKYDIDMETLGCGDLLVMPLKKEQEAYATHRCSIVRWPYMKIKDCAKMNYYCFSALCLIHDNKLGNFLRQIENPEHNNWESNLTNNQTAKRRAAVILQEFYKKIEDYIDDALNITSESIIDPNKAGEFLKAVGIGGTNKAESITDLVGDNDNHKSTVGKLRPNKPLSLRGEFDDDDGFSLNPEIGNIDKKVEGNVIYPEGHNAGTGGDPRPGTATGGLVEGDLIVLANINKSPVKYKLIAVNAEMGKYKIAFISPRTSDECYLQLFILDDSNNKEKVQIKTLKCNGDIIDIKSESAIGPFAIEMNKKCIIEIETLNQKGNFGSEVKVLCK